MPETGMLRREQGADRIARAKAVFRERSISRSCSGSSAPKISIAPIDHGVLADEQATIDLYFRSGLIKDKLDARSIVDASFNGAIEKA